MATASDGRELVVLDTGAAARPGDGGDRPGDLMVGHRAYVLGEQVGERPRRAAPRVTIDRCQPILIPNTRCRITTIVKNPKKALNSSRVHCRQAGAWISFGRNLRFTYQTCTP